MTKKKNPIREAIASCHSEIVSAAVFSFFINMLMLSMPLYMLQLFDRVLSSRSEETLILLTAAALGAVAIMGVLTSIRWSLLVRASGKLDTLLGERVHGALIRQTLANNTARNAQGMRDLSQIRNFLAGQDIHTLFDLPWAPLFLVIIYILHPLLGLIATAGAIVLLLAAFINQWLTNKPLGEANEAARQAHAVAESNVRNAEVIEGMGMLKGAAERWRERNSKVLRHQSDATDRGSWMLSFTRAGRLGLQMIMMGAGAWLVIQGQVSPGAMIAGALIMARALQPFERAISTWKNMLTTRAAYLRLSALLESAPPIVSTVALPRPEGRLEADGVMYFPPRSETAIIKGVSFTLEAGEALGVVGPSGAGKSSLAKLLVGVWAASRGTVRLDGADVASWDRNQLGQYLGYLPQEVELFSGTVAENISRFTEATSEEIILAAQRAGVHDMVLHLPDGYDTQIGEGGAMLSGGQRQRVGLARALFRDPPLLILDEPNANLDSEGEAALVASLTEAKARGVTIVIVAHRPSMLGFVDKILLLQDGRVSMFGPRSEVLPKVIPARARPRLVNS